jgi:hypothetical protein
LAFAAEIPVGASASKKPFLRQKVARVHCDEFFRESMVPVLSGRDVGFGVNDSEQQPPDG